MIEVRYTPDHTPTINVLVNPDDKTVVLPSGWHLEFMANLPDPIVDIDSSVVWVPHGWKVSN